jgi:hypothetical protein
MKKDEEYLKKLIKNIDKYKKSNKKLIILVTGGSFNPGI